jgi:hypothetical protein
MIKRIRVAGTGWFGVKLYADGPTRILRFVEVDERMCRRHRNSAVRHYVFYCLALSAALFT